MANNVTLAGMRRSILNAGIPVFKTTEETQDVHILNVTGGATAGGTTPAGATQIAGAFQTTPTVVTNGQSANVQVDSSGNLRSTLVSGAGSTGADAVANTALFQTNSNTSQTAALRPLATANFAYNGASWDRVRLAVANGGLQVEEGPFTITRATADLQIKASAGFVHTINIGAITATPTAGLLTIYDSLTEAGTVLFAGWIFATQNPVSVLLDARFATGLFVGYDATLTNVSVSVSFR